MFKIKVKRKRLGKNFLENFRVYSITFAILLRKLEYRFNKAHASTPRTSRKGKPKTEENENE